MEPRDLNRMFDALAPTPEQEQAGLDRLLQTERKVKPMKKLKKLTVAAVAAALMVISCAAAGVPVLDKLFQVLAFEEYYESEDGIDYSVSAPRVEATGALAEKINVAIQEKTDQHLAKAQRDWDDYREAFFATGGTEDEWGNREMDVIISYEIKSQTENRVSFVVSFAEGWVSSYEERYYYNLDFAENRELTLQDLLGDDWVAICNAAIQKQIADGVGTDGITEFFPPDQGGFTTVDENTSFYVREDGKVIVCFAKYTIAAGTAGNLEVVI